MRLMSAFPLLESHHSVIAEPQSIVEESDVRRALRVGVLFLLASLTLQTAWILAVPPYRGSDEFEHVYRAGSVARGFWTAREGIPEHGRGALIAAPRQLVVDAKEVCEFYSYTEHDNCNPVAPLGDGLVSVASAAVQYNPVFYWLVGTPARMSEGAQSLYLMRVAGSLLCSILIGAAAWVTALWARTRWPLVALGTALTPVVFYSTAMPAPNGVEMAASLCLWAGLLGLGTRSGLKHARPSLWVMSVGAIVLSTVRSLGPAWLMLGVAVGLLLFTSETRKALRRYLTLGLTLLTLVASAVVGGVLWSLSQKTNQFDPTPGTDWVSPWAPSATQIPLWFMQSIAAFPTRNEPAPAVVYVCGSMTFLMLMIAGLRAASRRLRRVMVLAILLSLAVPYAITVLSLNGGGFVWQGRYTLPFSFSTVLLAGLALELKTFRHRLLGPLALCAYLLTLISHVVSVVHVQLMEEHNSPLSGDPRWLMAPAWSVGIVTAVGITILAGTVLKFRSSDGHGATASVQLPDATARVVETREVAVSERA